MSRKKALLFSLISFLAALVSCFVFSIFNNAYILALVFIFVALGLFLNIKYSRCPYCHHYLSRVPLEAYCPYCGQYFSGDEN